MLADFDIEIVEMHHRHKKDAPSGTALSLARAAAAGRDQDFAEVACHGRQGMTGERPAAQIGIHAVRGGDVVGDHTVIFAREGERIELVHRAHSRDTFAAGALRAARFLADKPKGLFSMKDALGLDHGPARVHAGGRRAHRRRTRRIQGLRAQPAASADAAAQLGTRPRAVACRPRTQRTGRPGQGAPQSRGAGLVLRAARGPLLQPHRGNAGFAVGPLLLRGIRGRRRRPKGLSPPDQLRRGGPHGDEAGRGASRGHADDLGSAHEADARLRPRTRGEDPHHAELGRAARMQPQRRALRLPAARRTAAPAHGVRRLPCRTPRPAAARAHRHHPLPVRGHSSVRRRQRAPGEAARQRASCLAPPTGRAAAVPERLLRTAPPGVLRGAAGCEPARRLGDVAPFLSLGRRGTGAGRHRPYCATGRSVAPVPREAAEGACVGPAAAVGGQPLCLPGDHRHARGNAVGGEAPLRHGHHPQTDRGWHPARGAWQEARHHLRRPPHHGHRRGRISPGDHTRGKGIDVGAVALYFAACARDGAECRCSPAAPSDTCASLRCWSCCSACTRCWGWTCPRMRWCWHPPAPQPIGNSGALEHHLEYRRSIWVMNHWQIC